MLLSISTTHEPATDLGFLLHKHPDNVRTVAFPFGDAHVFFPEATDRRATATLLIEIDPVRLVRRTGTRPESFALAGYVNDRPYVASSFTSVVLGKMFGTAMSGRCDARPELARTPIPVEVEIPVLPCRGGELIVRRYLRHRRPLAATALERLADEDSPDPDGTDDEGDREEQAVEDRISLNAQRLGAVLAVLKDSGARRVIDLGCGEGRLLAELATEPIFREIVGVDVSHTALERAAARLRLDRQPERQRDRIRLLQGGLTYRDRRLEGFDAAAVVEVIEHLDPPRLDAFEQVVFGHARPATVVVTTPNREHNVRFESLPAGELRHRDHRFEWTRAEFAAWSIGTAGRHGYEVRFAPIGDDDPEVGPPTQMAVFSR